MYEATGRQYIGARLTAARFRMSRRSSLDTRKQRSVFTRRTSFTLNTGRGHQPSVLLGNRIPVRDAKTNQRHYPRVPRVSRMLVMFYQDGPLTCRPSQHSSLTPTCSGLSCQANTMQQATPSFHTNLRDFKVRLIMCFESGYTFSVPCQASFMR